MSVLHIRPALTTVDMNLELLGRTAPQHLFAAIDGRATPGVHKMPCRLVIRDSASHPDRLAA
ncbi:substrate-binding domain-containing protein [Nonomuraea longispora]|uniref:substrate-binding domain-containing protein n=1 Tax=Nonomuraea longispora TaxID=1848320 RepID=UPI001FE365E3|nr:substrate-binding domain-containing protein [Nonomuraea longispora]